MRWTKRSVAVDVCKWHKYFAWFPILIGNIYVWLEFIEGKESVGPPPFYIVYRFPNNNHEVL